MSKDDWPIANLTVTEAPMLDGEQHLATYWSHTIDEGTWVKYDGIAESLQGLKGEVIRGEREPNYSIRYIGETVDVEREFIVRWTDGSELHHTRDHTKPSGPPTDMEILQGIAQADGGDRHTKAIAKILMGIMRGGEEE